MLPTIDRPSPPEFSTALVPEPPEFSFVGRTFVAGPAADALSPLAATTSPFESKPTVQDDPSATAAWRALLSPIAFADPLSPPPERLTIPDPFDYLQRAALRTAPADALAPEVGRDRPAPIALPVP